MMSRTPYFHWRTLIALAGWITADPKSEPDSPLAISPGSRAAKLHNSPRHGPADQAAGPAMATADEASNMAFSTHDLDHKLGGATYRHTTWPGPDDKRHYRQARADPYTLKSRLTRIRYLLSPVAATLNKKILSDPEAHPDFLVTRHQQQHARRRHKRHPGNPTRPGLCRNTRAIPVVAYLVGAAATIPAHT